MPYHFRQTQNIPLSLFWCEAVVPTFAGAQLPRQPLVVPWLRPGHSSHWNFVQLGWELMPQGKQAAFSYYLPPLIPAGMQDAVFCALLPKGKLASPLPNNSDKVSYFSRHQIRSALPLHMANIHMSAMWLGHKCWSPWLAFTKNRKA